MEYQEKIKCLYCKENVIIEPNGFCPECRGGAELPTKYFIEVLVRFSSFSMEEYMVLCQHSMSDVSEIAERELRKIWISNQKRLESVLYNFKKKCYDVRLFELILQLPLHIIYSYREELQRLGMKTNEKMLVIWLKMLRSLEWISVDQMKEILYECLSHESNKVRNKAMACWLDDQNLYERF